jgi:amidase
LIQLPISLLQLFRDQGCSRGTVPRPPGPRYERSRPNELWHIDIKGPFFINLGGRDYIKTWIVGLVDDHSRFLVKEGFGWPALSEPDVDEAVKDAARRLEGAGAILREVSVPMHLDGIHIWNAIAVEGAAMLMVRGNSMGTNWKGHYSTSLLDAYARGRLTRADDLSDTVKLVILAGQYLQDAYHGRYYAKGQNLGRTLTAAYGDALRDVDLLAMPTIPMRATRLPAPDATREEKVARALEMIPNTSPFDVTGHPAMNVPCAMSSGLPVGMMLVGRHWEDATVLRAARAFEETGAYSTRPRPAAAQR